MMPKIEFSKEWCQAAAEAEAEANASFSAGVPDVIQPQLVSLRVVLLALIPTYSQAASVPMLAAAANCSQRDVHDALYEPLVANQVRYHLMDDTYSVIKQGDAL